MNGKVFFLLLMVLGQFALAICLTIEERKAPPSPFFISLLFTALAALCWEDRK